jgi:cellulose synthase/poly-beta-1,6-N-acetylglucosamine synthase-like glycosyltransferase
MRMQKNKMKILNSHNAVVVQEDALKNIVNYFLADSSAMAVTPSVRIYKPNNVLQLIQKVEYGLGILFRKILSYLGAMYVTPGPFSIFKREVFLKIGPYRYAHQTEDMELAMRMQKNKMKILNSHNAVVWTVAPNTLKKLYKQRVRWTYGFIKNASDYRFIFFNREYGNLGLLILPMAAISIISVTFMVGRTIYSFLESFSNEIIKIQTVGIHLSLPDFTFSWFSFNTEFIALASAVTALGSIVMILVSRKITEGRVRMGMDLIYFFTLYIFIAPLWLTKALLNAVFSIKTTWR